MKTIKPNISFNHYFENINLIYKKKKRRTKKKIINILISKTEI